MSALQSRFETTIQLNNSIRYLIHVWIMNYMVVVSYTVLLGVKKLYNNGWLDNRSFFTFKGIYYELMNYDKLPLETENDVEYY